MILRLKGHYLYGVSKLYGDEGIIFTAKLRVRVRLKKKEESDSSFNVFTAMY